jgi:hypothetical protein
MMAQNCFGPIVAGDSSRKWKQSLSVASGQNHPPAVTARIDSIEFHCLPLRAHFDNASTRTPSQPGYHALKVSALVVIIVSIFEPDQPHDNESSVLSEGAAVIVEATGISPGSVRLAVILLFP